jgi:hypothetical protein
MRVTRAPKGKFLMSHLSKWLVGVVASTMVLSNISATAHAQTTNVLTLDRQFEQYADSWVSTQYTFSSSMILNRIGFVASNNNDGLFQYSITGKGDNFFFYDDSRLDLVDNNGIRWYTLPTPITLIANDSVLVETIRTHSYRFDENTYEEFQETALRVYSSVIPNVNVVKNGVYGSGSELLTNSNLRISNPGSNVAPEPGTFALALTGGGALIGICIRRRRNAG